MSAHRYRIGQAVVVLPRGPGSKELQGDFVVTEQFRHRGEPYYCVKGRNEPYERSLAESRLRATKSGDRHEQLLQLATDSSPLH